MAKRIGVILSGCGVMDGSEIHEAVLTLLAIDRAGAEAICMAPNTPQRHVINHLTNEESRGETRNVLMESARIARGKIRDVAGMKSSEIDALIFPGGFGAAKNLCDYAFKGPDCSVHPEVAKLLTEVHRDGKPVGTMCIAPVIAGKLFGSEHFPQITIGTDKNTAKDIEKMGAKHVPCPVTDVVVDKAAKIVSTPAYMLANSIKEAAVGIEKLVQAVVDLA
ncbi:MAG TPA: isoprenoid biosynthesis glyoxalase ElbB [Verrucomicrobiae bacterium]|nr:isoprenoid biosynthesis glyoxalase ElbB [Verrucomicrobiae bacterium]